MGISFEEAAGLQSRLRVDPSVQQERDQDSERLKIAETIPGGGGLIPTSRVVEGSAPPAGEPALQPKRRKVSFEEARGTEAASPDNVRSFIEAGQARLQREDAARAEEAGKPQPGRGVRNAAEIASVADFVLSVPGMLIGTGANLASTAMGVAAGQDPKEAWGKGREIGGRIGGMVSNPLQKIMTLSPEFQRAYEESFTTGAMDKVMGVVEKIGDEVEKKTGGRIIKEQVQTAFDTFLTGGMGYGAAKASGPKPLYPQMKGVRVTDPRQLFPDDAAHDAFMAEFKQPGTAVATTRQPRAPFREPEIVEPGSPAWAKSDLAKAAALGGGATALALNDEEEGGAALAVAGGIKGKGGMWHPAAVERLAAPLMERLVPLARDAEPGSPYAKSAENYKTWSSNAISRYLNRHAGTADDPLKDVRLPSGKTWEEVTDDAFHSRPASEIYAADQKALPAGTPMNEPIWSIDSGWQRTGGQGGVKELSDYLSHVGDFLRQNVDPAKLPQYDLVRAVKETARNDERVAKEMDKASAAQTAQLPVHKEYPGGMKWVELKLPEKLTEEQGKGVRKATAVEMDDIIDQSNSSTMSKEGYVALDTKGKPLVNTYTQNIAGGRTPQEAWLAGRLAEEGNQMGHCVGGYCEGVAGGESRIYSLRDEKGRSHVTVEVEPAGVIESEPPRMDLHPDDPAGRVRYTREDRILQIKGKQNRAPDAKYLPFVQDFVKGGKWGEVGDLEHTGLRKLAPDQVTELGLEGLYHTPEDVRTSVYKKLTVPEFQDRLQGHHPNVEIHLIERPSGAITLADLKLREGVPDNTGAGQAALADTVAYADANGRGMMLLAAPMGRGAGKPPMPVPKLVEIYGRHGFKESADQPFPDVARRMYRNPKGFENAEEPTIEVKPQAAEGSTGGVPGAEPGATGSGAGEGGAGVVPGEGAEGGPGRRQEGRADPRLLGGIAAAGIGGVLGAQIFDDQPMRGALWGAMAGGVLPFVAPIARTLAAGADPALGLLSTRIKNISIPIWHRAVEYERQMLRDNAGYLSASAPFLRELKAAKNPALEQAILSNDGPAIQGQLLASGNPALIQGWMQVRQVLNTLGTDLQAAGRISQVLPDYFPRIVKDREGLLKAVGSQLREGLEARLAEANRKAAPQGGLTQAEESALINSWMQEQARRGAPGFTKGRTFGSIPANLAEFYASPAEALSGYIHAATADLARARFFGKDLSATGHAVNVDESIGALVRREQARGNITYAQAEELRGMLQSRFGAETSMLPDGMKNTLQDAKNLANVGLLGNVVSSATQLGDSLLTVYAQGLSPTIAAVARKLTGRMQVTAEDLGVVNHISEEFTSPRKSAQFLQTVFKWSGFSLIDRIGKDLQVQAGFGRFKRLSETPAGRAEIARKYGQAYEPTDYNQMISDLQAGRRSDLTDSLLFHELSDMQPITKMEVPEGYLRMPNGRIVYMLKTFMLKQLDIARRDGWNEMKAGNLTRGAGNIAKLATALAISGVPVTLIKDWLEGKEMGDNAFNYVDNVLKTFGWSQYVLDQLKSGSPAKAVANIIAPPYSMIDDIIKGDPKAVRYIPFVGRMLYGALDKEELAREKRDRARDNRDEDALEKRREERRRQRGY